MHFEPRLWLFTAGFRWKIVWSFLVGLLGVGVGVARLALLGWLLGQIITGVPLRDLVLPVCLIAAIMVLRGVLEHVRNMMAHRTAAAVQKVLRRSLYDRLMDLGPGFVTQQRSGEIATASAQTTRSGCSRSRAKRRVSVSSSGADRLVRH